MQRVNEASFFEVTTSRSCEAVNGFHNVTFGPGGKAIIGTLRSNDADGDENVIKQ